jgi:predicted tellurium resistance membrane protein TerC
MRHRVLLIGALGAIAPRLIFIMLGVALVEVVEVTTGISLAVIAGILGTAGFAGWYTSRRRASKAHSGREVLEMERPVAAHRPPYWEESR